MVEKKRKQGGEVYPIFAKKSKTTETDSAPQGSTAEHELDSATASLKLLELKALLDLSEVDTEHEIATRLDRIATTLIREVRLVVKRRDAKDVEFEILEAEFYLQIGDCHEDPFTHGSEEQRFSGRWYFHRAPRYSKDSHRSLTSTTEYRGGSRKGMDLTFGGPALSLRNEGTSSKSAAPISKDRLLRGGVLLRSVRQLNTRNVISGPSLLVDQILSVSDASSIQELVETYWGTDTSAFNSDLDDNHAACLFLKPVAPSAKDPAPIYFSPRIGLDLSHPGTTSPSVLPLHPRIRFLPKRYRFFVHPEWLVANGRPQTFLGVLQSCMSSSSALNYDEELKKSSLSRDIARVTGVKDATSAKYLADYKAGRAAGSQSLQAFIGANGKGASSSPATYLKMMGALSTIPL